MGAEPPASSGSSLPVLLGVSLGSALFAIISYMTWGFAYVFQGMGALAPQVGPDLTITASPLPSTIDIALGVALGATFLAAVIGFMSRRSAVAARWPLSGLAICVGVLATWGGGQLIRAALETMPESGMPWWTGLFPGAEESLESVLVMVVPALVGALVLGASRSR